VLRGTLAGTLSAAGKLTLAFGGKSVAKLKAGRYTFSITDKNSKKGFALQAVRKTVKTITGVAFVGKRSVVVSLTVGAWTFYASPGGTKRTFAVS
jgi:hypothetical protein